MSGNSFGRLFTLTSFGESHGFGLGCIVDGCPPGLELTEGDIQPDLDRRKPGTSKYTTQRRESDLVEILSGTFEGKTTGTPIGLLIRNEGQKSKDYADIKDQFRPAHADYTYQQKYGIRDYRGGGRASARETAMRVAGGAIAKKYLRERLGIHVYGYLSQMGHIRLADLDLTSVNNNPFFCAEPEKIAQLETLIDDLRRAGDSVGARITLVATGMVPGLGEPVFDKLDADIASALMGINAVKGVEIGAGFDVVSQRGSEHRDALYPQGFGSNNAGGILGGISSGQNIIAHLAVKPTSSITQPVASLDTQGREVEVVTRGRHDPCVGLRAVPIAEAMLALVLMDHYLRNRAQNMDVQSSTPVI